MKYIDADELTTIIEERKAQQDQWINRYHDPINQGISYELTEILSIITSLQQEQPEVELEAIIRIEFGTRAKVEDGRRLVKLEWDKFSIIARHFYELGLNARKED